MPNVFPGADEQTPSRSQYFSWINNTNEGSTAAQTLVNLEFFAWLQREYGMVLDIYAWDAGNIDGGGCYGSMDSERFRERFPDGVAPIAAAAAEINTRLGLWGGPDGFGETPAEEAARTEMMVSLCRDHNFMLFKIDGVCGQLREEKRDAFAHMMTECRKYSPDLILLNHRLNLGHAVEHCTTWLWEGAETYIDVHMANTTTAPHHRAGALARGLPPDLQRLTEDHGVCLSSCLDYWEDDLILQAFNRCLILAPEIYGNPWLLRDDESPRLARIYNLHRRYRDILVNGMLLSEAQYGPNAVSRGNDRTRLITLRNLSWEPVEYTIKLDRTIGLQETESLNVRQYHPVERVVGDFSFGDETTVEVPAFRSCLVAVSADPCPEPSVVGCDFEVVRDMPNHPVELRLLGTPGTSCDVSLPDGSSQTVEFPGHKPGFPPHRKLGELTACPVPTDAEELYEATCFAADNDALEVRELRRSGPTQIPAVQAARDAFFEQELFRRRGIWDKYMFDGKPDTFFSVWYRETEDMRIRSGALRVQFGKGIKVDRLILQALEKQEDFPLELSADVTADLKDWQPIRFRLDKAAPQESVDVAYITRNGSGVRYDKHQIITYVADLEAAMDLRYLRCSPAPGRVSSVAAALDGNMLDRSDWRGSNLFGRLSAAPPIAAWQGSFELGTEADNSYLAVALDGEHGVETAYVAVRAGRPVGAPDRSPSYPSNVFECRVREASGNTTHYIPVTPEMHNREIDVVVLLLDGGTAEIKPAAWITSYPPAPAAVTLTLPREGVE